MAKTIQRVKKLIKASERSETAKIDQMKYLKNLSSRKERNSIIMAADKAIKPAKIANSFHFPTKLVDP